MFKKINLSRRNIFTLTICLFFFGFLVSQTAFAQSDIAKENPYLLGRFWANGKQLDKVSFPGRPPKYFRMPAAATLEPNVEGALTTLTNVPAFNWSYGCSATSGAMMAGYYDNNGFANMYAGPENGGVCPMDNDPLHVSWGTGIGGSDGECPLSATHLGKDGLAVRGHVDDYWMLYGDAGPDPWIGPPGWPEHVHADCTGDFMKTNQSTYGNSDGETTFWFYTNGSPTPYADLDGAPYGIGTYADYDGGCGLADFFTSRGYTVTAMYNQHIYGYDPDGAGGLYGPNTLGFTYAQFQAEIDAGRPVLIHLEGHTMLGYGYNTTGNIIYIHDTWDYSNHTMTWGGSYGGYLHMGVTVIQLEPSSVGIVLFNADSYSAPDTAYVTVWDDDLNTTGNADTTIVEFECPSTTDTEIMELTETDTSTGIFTGEIALELNAVAASDSILQVQDGDTIIVTYEDADHDGLGNPATLTDTALISLITIPTNLIATAGTTYVFLDWDSQVNAAFAGYNVYRSASLTGTKTKLNTILLTESAYQDIYLTSGTTYYYWVTAVDTVGGETDYSSVLIITTLADGGGGDNDGDDGGGGNGGSGVGSLSGCFIATACYGTPMSGEVRALSQFRDEYLLTNSFGKFFVGNYYRFSPYVAEYISQRPMLKKFVRMGLKPLVSLCEKLTKE